jgi:hypothetical protein
MKKNRFKVEGKDRDGKDLVLYVVRPNVDQNYNAQIEASKAFQKAICNGLLVKAVLEEKLRSQGIWDDNKQEKLEELTNQIKDNLTKLKAGGCKASEGRKLAIDVRIARMKITELMSERNTSEQYTAEAMADNAKFDYLASVCIVNEEGKPYFKDVDDYKENGDFPTIFEAASKVASMIYGLDDNWEAELPENRFLKRFHFVNEDLRLINKDGEFVTIDEKKVDENFRYVNKDGKFTDTDGNIVDEDGLPVVEFQPFLDDDGNPIIEEVEEKEEKEETVNEAVSTQ